jgi:hypothetical protein
MWVFVMVMEDVATTNLAVHMCKEGPIQTENMEDGWYGQN